MTTYNVDPLDRDDDDDEKCPSCETVIRWSRQVYNHGGLHYSTSGTCTCGEWSRQTDQQNRRGETWYTYAPAPWGQRGEI
jgi:hypothetical protein